MNTITMTDTFFTKYARFEQEKYRELKNRENSDNNINETSKSFEEIFTMYHDELKTSETPYDAILTVDNKLKKKNEFYKDTKLYNLYNFRVSYD